MKDAGTRLQDLLGEAYQIQRQLGEGGMALVFLAHDNKHDRAVAIKVLRPELAASLGGDRFLREIQIAARLSHPHILPLYDSGGDETLLYYVMPYVEGESLRDRLTRERQLPVEEAIGLTRQVASALAYAHAQGVVHRDIKPENILLHGGEAVVSDFGIARAIAVAGSGDITQTGIAVGTPAYMSPEQAAGDDALDGRSDIYSLGCVLYEMLAGHAPFLGRSPAEILARHSADPVPSVRSARSTIPPALERTIERALAKVPADRFHNATQFAEQLETGAFAAVPRSRPRRWPWLAGVAALAVAVVGAFALRSVFRGGGASQAASPNSVAVLYFDSQSPDTADAYLADGVTEEIMQRLGDVPRLSVKSRYAVRRYRGTGMDPATIGRTLGVANLVTGSLQHIGNELRVRAELVRATTGVRVWGDTYDRADMDLLNLETDVATAIATAIAGRLRPTEQATLAKRPTASPQAYDHSLRGDYFLAQRTPAATALAIAQYEAALGMDSTFSRAWARDAVCYALYLAWEWPYQLSPDSILALGVRAADHALAGDSTSSDAWMAYGMFQWFLHPSTWDGGLEAHRRAVALDSTNAEAHNMLGITLFYRGQDAAAAEEFRHALAIDPLRPISLARLGEVEWFAGRSDEAARYIDSALAVAPAFVLAYFDRAKVRLGRHDPAGAKADIETVFRIEPGEKSDPDPVAFGILAAADAQVGDTAAARDVVQTLRKGLGTFDGLSVHRAAYAALALLSIGDRNGALRVLERAKPRNRTMWWDLRWQEFDPLRGEPRFQQVLAGFALSGAPSR